MNRRGQGISINMVIIGAIALIVLVIAILLVSRGGRNISESTDGKSCLAQGGTCKAFTASANGDGCPEREKLIPDANCASPTPYCCRYDFGG